MITNFIKNSSFWKIDKGVLDIKLQEIFQVVDRVQNEGLDETQAQKEIKELYPDVQGRYNQDSYPDIVKVMFLGLS